MITDSERRMLFTKWETLAEMLFRVSKIQRDTGKTELAIQIDPLGVPDELIPLIGALDRVTVEAAWKSGCARCEILPPMSHDEILAAIASSAFSIGLSITAGEPTRPSTPLSVIFGAFFGAYNQVANEREQLRTLLSQQVASKPVPPPPPLDSAEARD